MKLIVISPESALGMHHPVARGGVRIETCAGTLKAAAKPYHPVARGGVRIETWT